MVASFMDKNSTLFYQSAQLLRMPTTKLVCEIDGFKISLGRHTYYFRGGDTPYNSGSGSFIARNKYCANKLLERGGIPVPKAIAIVSSSYKPEALKKRVSQLTFPLVAKPCKDSNSGKNVLCNISDINQLEKYLTKSFNNNIPIISIEEFHHSLKCYRILVFFGKVIGIVERTPAEVIGNGKSSLQELIDEQNIKRDSFKDLILLPPIINDDELNIRLKELELDLSYIPPKNEKVQLCYTSNASRGGTMRSLDSKHICPENATLAIKAAKILDLNNVGFDVVCEDIMLPMQNNRGVFIEANDNPDMLIHERATDGVCNRVSKKIIARLIKKHPLLYLIHLLKNLSPKETFWFKASGFTFIILLLKLFWQN